MGVSLSMHSVLTIDATIEPAVVAVVAVDGPELRVVETHRVPLANGLTPTAPSTGDAAGGTAPIGSTPENGGTQPPRLDLTSMLRTPWSSAALIIPAEQYHSLNVDLPFNDPRKINKILELEVQDLVPFGVDEFLLQHRPVHTNGDGTYDVHVSIMPRERLATILAACKEAGVEPAIVSTATSVVAALPQMYPTFPRDTVVILFRQGAYYLTFIVGGEVRTDRVVDRTVLNGDAHSTEAVIAEMRISIAAAEAKYGCRFERVYLLDTPFTATEGAAGFDRPTAVLALPNISGAEGKGSELAAISAAFLRDKEPIVPLTNFRTGPFAYNLQLEELWRGLSLMRPYFLAALLTLGVALLSTYALREQQIRRLGNTLREQIFAVVPDLSAPEGRETDALLGQIKALDQQLENLGSPTQTSPLGSLLEISRELPANAGLEVSRFRMRGNQITLDLTAPDYAAAEAFKNTLRKKSTLYCRITMDAVPGGAAGRRSFRYEVFGCE